MKTEPHQRLVWIREQRGYENPTAAADAMGVKRPTYYGHENGTDPISRKAAMKYADFFRVSVGWILRGEGEPPKGVDGKLFSDVHSFVKGSDTPAAQDDGSTVEEPMDFAEVVKILAQLPEDAVSRVGRVAKGELLMIQGESASRPRVGRP